MKEPVFIFVTGGVLSGLGKGIVSSSVAKILQDNGKNKVIITKCDGYFNMDPGTQNPNEHGEVFVLNDGAEVDLDFGHYERFLNTPCFAEFSITSGRIISKMLDKERKGDYLGKTVQVIPHLTGLIREEWMEMASKHKANFVLIEIGGTVGDLENLWFLEAARELLQKIGRERVLFIHLGYVPEIGELAQQKTKPFQQSIQLLRDRGIFPDILIGRSGKPLCEKTKNKLNWLCNVPIEAIYSSPDLEYTYELPLLLHKEGIIKFLERRLGVVHSDDFKSLKKKINKLKSKKTKTIRVGICGKYTEATDSYLSIEESLTHASLKIKENINIEKVFIDTDNLSYKNMTTNPYNCDCFIVPGGFGSRGIEGKINVIRYCRENNIPFLGICYGLQLAVIEFARNVCGLKKANTTEVDDKTQYKVIDIMPDQRDIVNKGGTMRLGKQEAFLKKGSLTRKIYGKDTCFERHRHRYEVNPEYHEILEKKGLVISGKNETGELVEFIEYPKNDFLLATQAHPELQSTLDAPAPLFVGLLEAANSKKK